MYGIASEKGKGNEAEAVEVKYARSYCYRQPSGGLATQI